MTSTSMYDLTDRVAIVTGGGQGIGKVISRAFADAGANVVIAEIDADRSAAVAAEIGNRAISAPTDVSDPGSTEAMAAAAMDAFGRIDVLVNNAAIFSTLAMRPFWEIPVDEWRRVMDVNITGSFLAARAAVGPMRAAGRGRIINFASAAVTMGRPNYLHYIASKAAVIGMTRSMARELGGDGVTANAILPGAVFTEIPRATVTPEQKKAIVAGQCIPRPQEPGDLVGTVLFLASDASAFMTGQSLTVDGGNTHL